MSQNTTEDAGRQEHAACEPATTSSVGPAPSSNGQPTGPTSPTAARPDTRGTDSPTPPKDTHSGGGIPPRPSYKADADLIERNVPKALKERPQWVLWSYEWEVKQGKGRWAKVPYQAKVDHYRDRQGNDLPPRTRKASHSNSWTWATYRAALNTYLKYPELFNGIGYVFSENDPLAGVDADRCLSSDGVILDWATPILNPLQPSYRERSPSGNGLKTIVVATLPGKGLNKGGFGPDGNSKVEMYDQDRFFTITGDIYGECREIRDHADAVQSLYRDLENRKKGRYSKPTGGQPRRSATPLSDERLFEIARKSKQGPTFRALFDAGDISGYPSPSEADFALLDIIAFYWGPNIDNIERVFRMSAIGKRDKVDMHTNYVSISIANVLKDKNNFYDPDYGKSKAHQKTTTVGGVDLPPLDIEAIRKRIQEIIAEKAGHLVFEDLDLLKSLWRVHQEQPNEYLAIAVRLKQGIDGFSIRDLKYACKHSTPPPAHSRSEEDDRPEIEITTEIHEMADQAISVLAQDPCVFRRGDVLVRLVRDAGNVDQERKKIRRQPETPLIALIEECTLFDILSRDIYWLTYEKTEESDKPIKVKCKPPKDIVPIILARKSWHGIRELAGIVETPVIRPDGSLIVEPGYDEDTGLYYAPNLECPPIPAEPTIEDARRAVDLILNLIADFPFAGPCHWSAWVAALLSPFARYATSEPFPMFLLNANVAKSGKTKLVDIIAIIATGRTLSRMSFYDDNVEMQKQFLAVAIEGDRMVMLDNVPNAGAIGGPVYDYILTGNTIKGRILGFSKLSGELPWRAILYATGNNLSVKGDGESRMILIRLDSKVEDPGARDDFRISGKLLDYVHEHRGELVAACLTILRAYFVAGRPDQGLTRIRDNYADWSRSVRDAVHWVTGQDPCATREEIISADRSDEDLADLVRGLGEMCDWVPPNRKEKLGSVTSKEIRDFLEDNPDYHKTLRSILTGWTKDGKLPTTFVIGKRLNMVQGHNVKLESFRDQKDTVWAIVSKPNRKGSQMWSVEQRL